MKEKYFYIFLKHITEEPVICTGTGLKEKYFHIFLKHIADETYDMYRNKFDRKMLSDFFMKPVLQVKPAVCTGI